MSEPTANGAAGWVMLADLPRGDALRSQPLGTLGAQCRNNLSSQWRDVARWALGRASYDQLGAVWTDCNEFRVPAQTPGGGT